MDRRHRHGKEHGAAWGYRARRLGLSVPGPASGITAHPGPVRGTREVARVVTGHQHQAHGPVVAQHRRPVPPLGAGADGQLMADESPPLDIDIEAQAQIAGPFPMTAEDDLLGPSQAGISGQRDLR